MTAFCGLYITSECFGQIQASQDGMYNGRPQYFFSIFYNGNLINGWIYWSPDDNSWFVQDLSTNQNMSYLPFDRVHPNGTYLEWENVSLLSYGCLTNTTSFETDWYSGCPPTNFEFCCLDKNSSKTFVGIQNFEYYGYFDVIFYLEAPQFSGCATVIEGSIPNGSTVYNSANNVIRYESCSSCTANTFSCNLQPIYTTPTPIPVITANTSCGIQILLVNECQSISIPIMNVICNTNNVTTYGGNDGYIELIISGGTPPYNILWDNGNTGYGIYNLIAGKYSYIVTDYYGDYVISDDCTVYQPPIPTPPFRPSNICMTVSIDGIIERHTYIPSNYNGGIPSYVRDDGMGDIGWRSDFNPPFWSIESEFTAGDMVNYNPEYPPLTGWTWLISNSDGFAEGKISDCQNYDDFCMTLNVNSFATQPYRIQFQQSVDINGKPSWIDTTNVYTIVWTDGEFVNYSYWSLLGLPSYFTNPISNNNSSVPPLDGWVVQGVSGDITTNEGNCFSEYICASLQSSCGSEFIELISGNTIDNNPVWYGSPPCGEEGSFFIFWDTMNGYWSTSGLTTIVNFGVEARRSTSIYLGPFGNFYTDGDYTLNISEGRCNQSGRGLTITTTVNNPVTGSDGGVVIGVEGGTEPYEYSVDNGATYASLPIFYGLRNGTYIISVKDSNGVITKKSIILNPPQRKTVYQVSLKTTSRKTSETTTVTTTEYITKVSVVPSLPSGVVINFDLIHTDTFFVSPHDYSATLTLGSIMIKNEIEIAPNFSENNFSNEINDTLGCQNYNKYLTATTYTWQNVTMTHEDTVNLNTTVSIRRNGKYPCYSATNVENYSLYNLSIIGCDNCEVSNQQGLPTISPTITSTSTVLT